MLHSLDPISPQSVPSLPTHLCTYPLPSTPSPLINAATGKVPTDRDYNDIDRGII
jgi:hypothetical protein